MSLLVHLLSLFLLVYKKRKAQFKITRRGKLCPTCNYVGKPTR